MNNTTDTNQASGLYELCKEVYERTGWVTDPTHIDDTPLYTSDYLLEKLPNASYQLDKTRAGIKLTSFYTDVKWETVHSDTPLLALLKLTIALSEAGELNG